MIYNRYPVTVRETLVHMNTYLMFLHESKASARNLTNTVIHEEDIPSLVTEWHSDVNMESPSNWRFPSEV